MLWSAAVLIVWMTLYNWPPSPGDVLLLVAIYGVMGAVFGLVAGVVWRVGVALVRYVGGGWKEEPRS